MSTLTALEVSDAESAAVATAPRVTLESMKAKIAHEFYYQPYGTPLTLCILTMQNGFCIIGESCPASPENFNEDLGKQFAFENAIRQLWKLEGYALWEQLAAQNEE